LGVTATVKLVLALLSFAAVLLITLYATWLFVERIRKGESASRSFKEWVKHLFEAVWGL